jgi:hypothetical protein
MRLIGKEESESERATRLQETAVVIICLCKSNHFLVDQKLFQHNYRSSSMLFSTAGRCETITQA